MQRLVEQGGVTEVNVGGIHSRPGRQQRLRYVFLSQDEADSLRAMSAAGASVSAQDLPGAKPVPLSELLTSCNT
jgi:PTS system mannose-specific IIB component/fructoselysine and glucoselysine-specific PTS system IIB component